MTNYLIELSIFHIIMLLGYWFLLREERQYATMRLYLLGSTGLALILPLLHFPYLSMLGPDSPDAVYLDAFTLNALQLKAFQIEALSLTSITDRSYLILDGLFWIYLAICLMLLFKFLRGLMDLVALKRKSQCQQFDGYCFCILHNVRGSFTFFNWIFIGDEIYSDERQARIILKHEKTHVLCTTVMT
ncbi:MAG: hypothetical protein HKN87_19255 [Saprospiraceae bacterium]|nr:hypothetical protein [Saprospiraceae bacterium]